MVYIIIYVLRKTYVVSINCNTNIISGINTFLL